MQVDLYNGHKTMVVVVVLSETKLSSCEKGLNLSLDLAHALCFQRLLLNFMEHVLTLLFVLLSSPSSFSGSDYICTCLVFMFGLIFSVQC